MTRSARLVVSCLAFLALPGAARADLSLQLGSAYGMESLDVVPAPRPGTSGFFDIRFNETGTVNREALITYEIFLFVARPAGVTGGLRLLTGDAAVAVPPEIPDDDFVLSPTPPPVLTIIESDADHLFFNVTLSEFDEPFPDIDDGERAARVFWELDPSTPPGVYRVIVDGDRTQFGGGDPTLPLLIQVEKTDAFVVPEPGSLWLLAGGAVLALRRRNGRSPLKEGRAQ